jgi:phospholipid N-methyltransferase
LADPAVSFLKEFVSKPQEIGALVPSSATLARTMVEGVDWSRVEVVVEYGPGPGAITSAILPLVEGKRFFAIELNEAYADRFRRNFPQVPLYRDSVSNVVEICRAQGVDRIDCVMSGLPWANFSQRVQEEILDATFEVLADDGQFVTFAYTHGLALPSGRRFRQKLDERFREVKRSRVVWLNTPPAVVYHCRR